MAEPFELAALQRWMQVAITHSAVAASSATHEVIAASRALRSEERLAIYRNAYTLRLLNCLQELYPALAQLLGDENFGQFGLAYLQAHPPHSYTLARLADRFPDFLRATRPPKASDWIDLVIDLATLEQVIDEVFDGPGDEESAMNLAAKLEAVPLDERPNLRLRVSASLRLLTFSFPLDDLYTTLRRGKADPPLPPREPSHLAIWRRDYVVRRLPLSAAQSVLLERLAAAEPLAAAIAAASAEQTLDPALVSSWFQDWTAAGVLADVANPS